MTLLWIEGFDHYGGNMTRVTENGYTTSGTGNTLSTTLPRTGTHSLQQAGTATSFFRLLPALHAELVFCFGVYITSYPAATTTVGILGLDDSALANQCCFTLNNLGELVFKVGGVSGTAVAVTSARLILNVWSYLEIKVKIDNSVGAVVVKINAVECMNLSGIDTQSTAVAGAQRYYHSINVSGITVRYDDMYVLETSTSPNNDFLGEKQVRAYYPDVDGGTLQWSPTPGSPTTHFDKVDEDSPDDDSTYLGTSGAGNVDLLHCANGIALQNDPIAVQIVARYKLASAGSDTVRAGVHDGTNTINGSTKAPTTSYAYYTDMFETAPDGGIWTTTKFDALQLRVEKVT